jgi:hydroxysqualene synthase
VQSETAPLPSPGDHYENFPVASWLCPRRLRAPISAIYWFARTADDIADEGDAPMEARLASLGRYRSDLASVFEGRAPSQEWPRVFQALARAIEDHRLPRHLLDALLDAFRQDIEFSGQNRRYQDDAQLLDYCTRSANPVGRLLLHLYGIEDPLSLAQSDQICTALQLINFWQDLGVDLARGRWYPSQDALRRHGLSESALASGTPDAHARALVASYARDAWHLMLAGAPLAWRLPGRIGWELRLVVQGGLRILEKMQALEHRTWRTRPSLRAHDLALMAWRALWGTLPRPAKP